MYEHKYKQCSKNGAGSRELEKEIINQLKEQSEVDMPKISKNLGISEESTLYFISKLLRDKKVQITGLKVIQNQ